MYEVGLIITPFERFDDRSFQLLETGSILTRYGFDPLLFDMGRQLAQSLTAKCSLGFFDDGDFAELIEASERLLGMIPKVGIAFLDRSNFDYLQALGEKFSLTGRRLIVFGPAHNQPLQFCSFEFADICIRGDCRQSIVDLLMYDNRSTTGMTSYDEGRLWRSFDRGSFHRTNPYHDLDFGRLPEELLTSLSKIPLRLSRGCPNHCLTCGCSSLMEEVVLYPVSTVLEYMESATLAVGSRDFVFSGSPPNADMAHFRTFIEELRSRKLEVTLCGELLPHSGFDSSLCSAMAAVGFRAPVLKTPSLHPKTIATFQLGYDLPTVSQAVITMARAGLKPSLTLAVGWPGEGENEWIETLKVIEYLRPWVGSIARIEPLTLDLGSPLFNQHQYYGIELPERHKSFHWTHPGGNTLENRERIFHAFISAIEDFALLPQKIRMLVGDYRRNSVENAFDFKKLVHCPWDTTLVLGPGMSADRLPIFFATVANVLQMKGFRSIPYDMEVLLDPDATFKQPDEKIYLDLEVDRLVEGILSIRSLSLTLVVGRANIPMSEFLLDRIRARNRQILICIVVCSSDGELLARLDRFNVFYVAMEYIESLGGILGLARQGRPIELHLGVGQKAGKLIADLGQRSAWLQAMTVFDALELPLYRGRSIVEIFLDLGQRISLIEQKRKWQGIVGDLERINRSTFISTIVILDPDPFRYPSRLLSFLRTIGKDLERRFRFKLFTPGSKIGTPAFLKVLAKWNVFEITGVFSPSPEPDREEADATCRCRDAGISLATLHRADEQIHDQGDKAVTAAAIDRLTAGKPATVTIISKDQHKERENRDLIAGVEDGTKAFVGPDLVEIELCDACNLKCAGCWIHDQSFGDARKKKKVTFFETERFDELLDDFAQLKVKAIQLSGAGEPSLHPMLPEFLRKIKERGLWCNLVTNFTLNNELLIHTLANEKVDQITVSLWADSLETYLATHHGASPRFFDQVVKNIQLLDELKQKRGSIYPKIKIYNVISSLNSRKINEMYWLAHDLHADSIEFQPVDLVKGHTDSLALSKSQCDDVLQQLDGIRLDDHNIMLRIDPESIKTIHPELSEFARFFKPDSYKNDFNYRFDDLRAMQVVCRRGYCNIRVEEDNRSNVYRFYFNGYVCRTCRYCSSCSIDKDNFDLRVPFLTILGIGSFVRRLQSSDVDSGMYELAAVDALPCYVGWIYSRITASGKVIPCCKAAKMPLGDLKKQGFADIWNGGVYDHFRNMALTKKKSDGYFARIECYKACDNIGMNRTFHQEVMSKLFR